MNLILIVMREVDKMEKDARYYEQEASEEEFLDWYHKQDLKKYPKPSVTVDLIGLRIDEANRLQILLIKRKANPFRNMYALPGGFVEYEESINNAVLRETFEETTIDISKNKIIRLPAVSKPGRDPRMWVITNPNIVLFTPDDNTMAVASDDAKDAGWYDLAELGKLELAFDHKEIIINALNYLRDQFSRRDWPDIFSVLGSKFMIGDSVDIQRQLLGLRDAPTITNFLQKYRNVLHKLPTTSRARSTKSNRGKKSHEYEVLK